MRHYKAIVSYDGTNFYGFQVQAQERTVQGTIEATIEKISGLFSRVIGAGRTDSGVHAFGQVISFELDWKHKTTDLWRALNAQLPSDIVIRSLDLVHPNFHPRYNAISRQYRYTIINQPIRDVFKHRYSLFVTTPLNIDLMRQASQYLVGTYDFSSFGRPPQGSNTVRTIMQADWYINETELVFEITANAFLYRMVRNIVGTLLRIGTLKLTLDQFKSILDARDISKSGPAAAARGLCLVKIVYS